MNDPMNPYAAPQVEVTLAPGAQWMRSGSVSLRQTYWGLSLIYYGIILILLAIISMFPVMSLLGPRGGNLELLGILMIGINLTFLAGAILIFIGQLVCLAVPAETGAKGFIVAAVGFQVINIGASIVQTVMPGVFSPLGALGVGLLGLLGYVFFILFLRKLGEYIGRLDFVQRAMNILYGMILIIVVGVVAGGAVWFHPIFGLLILAVAIGGLIVFVMYVNLINALRKALRGD
jgi:hypothetical protein